jgi:WD40 repeat protein
VFATVENPTGAARVGSKKLWRAAGGPVYSARMLRILFLCAVGVIALGAENPPESIAIAITDLKRDKAVDFGTEIVPLFQKSCLACHNAKDAKGDLVLETPATILKGGESGPAVVPGKAVESLLLKAASHQTKPFMPPKNNKADAKPLSAEELGLVKLWINQGATGVVAAIPPVRWQALAENLNPIQATAITPDGQYAACSRGNQIDLYEVATLQFAGSLIDPGIGAADRDLIESLAFSPDGQILASGGFRNVKFWRQQAPTARKLITLPDAAGGRLFTVSSDGKRAAFVTTNQQARVFNIAENKLERELPAETNAIKFIALGGEKIALVLGAKEIKTTNTFEAPAEVSAIAWAPSGALIVATADNQIRIFNEEKETRKFDNGSVARLLAISGDGKRIATSADSAMVRLYNFEDGKLIAELKGDRREQENAAREQRYVNFAKSEIGYRKSNVDAAEKQQKAEAEALKKVTDAKAAADKTLAEKSEAAKKANEAKAGAQKVLGDANAAIAQATENKNLSQKLADAADSQTKSASASAAEAAQIFARAQGDRDSAYADVINLGAAAKADAAKTTEAHAAIDRAVVIKLSFEHALGAKAAAEKAAAEAAANSKLTAENKAKAEKLLADLTNQQKDADTKFKASEKAFADADAEVKKAETALKSVVTNLEGTTAVAKKADQTVADTKKLLADAEAAEKQANTALDAGKKRTADSEKKIRAVTFVGSWLVANAEDGTVRCFAAESGRPGPVRQLADKPAAALAADGSSIISLTADGSLSALDLAASWKLERQIGDGSDKSPLADRVLALDFSPDGKWLATGGGVASRSGELKIWNVADGALVREIKDAHSDTIFSVEFSPDQKHIASGGADKLMKVFEVDSGKFVRSFEGHTHHVLNVSWMRHGRTLASAGADSNIKLWDFASGEQKKTIGGATREITAFQFLDSVGEALAASGDNQLRLLREDGNAARTFGGASDYTQSAAITPDGRFVIAGGNDSQFRIWSGEKGDLLQTFPPPPRSTKSLATAVEKKQ